MQTASAIAAYQAAKCPGTVFLIDILEKDPLLGESVYQIGYEAISDRDGVLDEITLAMARFGAIHYPSYERPSLDGRWKKFFIGQDIDSGPPIPALKWLNDFATIIDTISSRARICFNYLCAVFAKEIACRMDQPDAPCLN